MKLIRYLPDIVDAHIYGGALLVAVGAGLYALWAGFVALGVILMALGLSR